MDSLAFVLGAFHWLRSSVCNFVVSFSISNMVYGEIPLQEELVDPKSQVAPHRVSFGIKTSYSSPDNEPCEANTLIDCSLSGAFADLLGFEDVNRKVILGQELVGYVMYLGWLTCKECWMKQAWCPYDYGVERIFKNLPETTILLLRNRLRNRSLALAEKESIEAQSLDTSPQHRSAKLSAEAPSPLRGISAGAKTEHNFRAQTCEPTFAEADT
ncbi:hypothetical protein RND71_012490 [Anisodus tanguticus]|uniref:Uncharacterized protein n=1 Tax=Anisodus tanguticus TaxID=243964 RepID=A0AAE1SDC4_9SOLA|nr:hypothetical protein RND71_012490 [Anisodus tanguticus]